MTTETGLNASNTLAVDGGTDDNAYTREEDRRRMARRSNSNLPLEMRAACFDGHRSVRLNMPQGWIGLATTTYSCGLTYEERSEAARRIAALWNWAAEKGLTTDQIESGDFS